MEILAGCSGWSYDGWKGTFYPENLPRKRWLEYYAERFDTVELNTTFYRKPSASAVKSWNERVHGSFRYSVKAHRIITHVKRFRDVKENVAILYGLPLTKRGCYLFQLPPSVKKDMGLLKAIIDQVDRRKNNAIEFRHESWFSEDVYRMMRAHNLAIVSLSSPFIDTGVLVTADVLYVRLHGREDWYDYDYTDRELRQWARTIGRASAKTCYVYFNNDVYANAPKNCLRFKELAGSR